ncbi:MAG TPA: phosphoesterase [Ruminococcaceae bacterium]|nr:phosphoesterase [Oscillospiraceae bacterium]
MIIKVDLHMHTCLSPCGENDMTPYNVVNLAKLLGYDLIAVTDHNSCLNCPAAVKVGEAAGITVVPGMELCTAEEIHNICLFPSLDAAKDFSDFVYGEMPDVKNRPEIFGEQIITDEEDNIIGYEKRLLTVASGITESEIVKTVSSYGGVCFPAHIDRSSYSILSVLGAFPETPIFKAAGLSRYADEKKLSAENPCLGNMKLFVNSDAHRLSDIPEPQNELVLPECSAKALIDYIKNQ